MNNQKRNILSLATKLLKISQETIQSVLDEEEKGYYNMTEGLQQTERGQTMESAISDMEDAINLIEKAIDDIEGILEL